LLQQQQLICFDWIYIHRQVNGISEKGNIQAEHYIEKYFSHVMAGLPIIFLDGAWPPTLVPVPEPSG
jgi:hypothetical protein